MNSSASTLPVTFSVYAALGRYNSALLLSVFVLYVAGLCLNLVLVLVICVESRLHRPMYVLLVNLSLSGVMGSSSVCPNIIKHLLSKRQETSVSGCLTQVFFTNVYAGCVFCILALMAYDRYVSICKPLLYHSIMTPAKVKLMLVTVYTILSVTSAVQVYLTSRLRLCTHSVDKLLCDSLVISNLSCKKTTVISVYGLCCAVCVIIFPCFLVILSHVTENYDLEEAGPSPDQSLQRGLDCRCLRSCVIPVLSALIQNPELEPNMQFESAETLLNSEVHMLLEHRKQQNESAEDEQELSEVFMKTLNYTARFSRFKNRETITAKKLHKFELASLANLCPEAAEEAKALIPSLEGRFEDEELQQILDDIQTKRSFQFCLNKL
ncbi:DNA-directed RNA polymerase II subunit RPB4 [Collichthys lucidus]|uniref:DNA-directed RNA polymerase II subunit RPB4 n=1 Tax=Collichthys lucidus TaxID=240159 RepID=A0A4U5V082_COLLU|nr:DNA-directed RNA polymerase II subunit RPB4 [Collichthys lucidus]